MRTHGLVRTAAGHHLAVWAPRVSALSLRILGEDRPLAAAGEGWWTVDTPPLPPGTPYALVLPDGRVRADPAALALVSDVHGPSAVFDPDARRAIYDDVRLLAMALVNEGEPPSALRAANSKFERRFRHMEAAVRARGAVFEQLPLERLEELWNEAKRGELNAG